MFPKVIDNFRGQYYFLSNFSPYGFICKNRWEWKTVEHYFQAYKSVDNYHLHLIRKSETPAKAKKLGSSIKLRDDWDVIKVWIMETALKYKFEQNKDIKQRLVDTKDAMLIEGNMWHDNFWGDCKCNKCRNKTGINVLGNLLMQIREEYENV